LKIIKLKLINYHSELKIFFKFLEFTKTSGKLGRPSMAFVCFVKKVNCQWIIKIAVVLFGTVG